MRIFSRRGISTVLACAIVLTIGSPPVAAGQAAADPAGASVRKPSPSVPPPRQGFSIVLVLGDTHGTDAPDALPAAAQRALADLKEFLPYKSFRLLDSQWTLCCGGNASGLTRLRGVDDQEYELELRANPDWRGPIHVRFHLREPRDRESAFKAEDEEFLRQRDLQQELAGRVMKEQELVTLERELIDLTAEHDTLKRQSEVGVKDPADLKRLSAQIAKVKARIEQLRKGTQPSTAVKSSGRTIIDTSFQMAIGETVVVGTSRLKGGSRALIALLTAVPKPKTPAGSR